MAMPVIFFGGLLGGFASDVGPNVAITRVRFRCRGFCSMMDKWPQKNTKDTKTLWGGAVGTSVPFCHNDYAAAT